MTIDLQVTGNVQVTPSLKRWLDAHGYQPETYGHTEYILAAVKAMLNGDLDAETYVKLINENKPLPEGESTMKTTKQITADDLFGRKDADHAYVRVKDAGEAYSANKSVALHSKTGQPVLGPDGEPLLGPSQYELAKTGALMKKFAQRHGIDVTMSEHEKGLLEECFQDTWVGTVGGEYKTKIDGVRVKTLLDDTTSGGVEAIPVWFDANLVSFPLLHSEILPYIDLVNLDRGRRIEGAAVGNPTVAWGQPEGTAFAEFDTAGLVTSLDTTIHPVVCAITFGRDALEDSPAALGSIVQQNLGQALLAALDNAIVNGNGTTQPEGITVASGTTAVPKDGGNGSAWTVADLENLMFAVAKQYRNRFNNPAFLSNDVTYGRIRGIAVGTGDQRRVFGLDHSSYQVLEWPYRVQQDLPNATLIFGCLKKYRLYRRLGVRFEWSKEGRTLLLSNEQLLVMRARYGGRVVDPSAFALITTGQA